MPIAMTQPLAALAYVACNANNTQDKGSEAARVIEAAGRVCYDSYGKGRSSAEFHAHIKEVGHGSVTEHVSITFYIRGISRGCSHELVRHRAGCAISQRSTRYVDESESEWILHPLIESADLPQDVKESLKNTINSHIDNSRRLYMHIATAVQEALEKAGADKTTARKQARGAARGVLGNALSTVVIWTANIRAIRHFIEQRASPAADAEIRLLACKIYEISRDLCPEYFDDYQRVSVPDGVGYALQTKYKKI